MRIYVARSVFGIGQQKVMIKSEIKSTDEAMEERLILEKWVNDALSEESL